MRLPQFSIRASILLVFILSLFVMAVVFTTIVINMIEEASEKNLMHQRALFLKKNEEKLKEITQTATAALDKFYFESAGKNSINNLKKDALEFKETLLKAYKHNIQTKSKEETKALLLELINAYRYNKDIGYFFVIDKEANVVAHPIKPSLNGKKYV